MDSSVPDPQLKNRIFGAILLVILAVLLIPLFLGEPRSNIEIPQKEEKKQFQSKIQPLPGSEGGIDPSAIVENPEKGSSDQESSNSTGLVLKQLGSSTVSETSKTEVVSEKETEGEKPAETTTEETAKATETVQSSEPKQAESVTAEEWALQAGIFSKKENADSIVKILQRHGFKPTLSQTQASFGEATRVWMGPFESKEKAEGLSNKLESIIGSGGYIAPYPFK